jgi:hypothetical protein
MEKLKIFQTEISIENKNYHVANYDLEPMVMVQFANLPTKETKKLFEHILSKYDTDTHSSIINFQEVTKEIDDFYSELNIIKSMYIQIYDVKNGDEFFIEYAIIVQVSKNEVAIKLDFHDKFKELFDRFLEI